MLRLAICSIGMLLLLAVASCGGETAAPVFTLLPPGRTGVTFANTITTNDSVNVQSDPYVYNGAGVAVGDIDNDGLPDLFFTGNMVSSRLYLNKGNMRFEDITERAGVKTNRWATGATMVDINNDGYLDIYVSVSGSERSKGADRANLLFINNGDHTFGGRGTVRHRRHRLHHARRLLRLQRRRIPRPLLAQQFTAGLRPWCGGHAPARRADGKPRQLQYAVSQQRRRDLYRCIPRSGDPATDRVRTRCGGGRRERRWVARPDRKSVV